jgi:hypothetical protein
MSGEWRALLNLVCSSRSFATILAVITLPAGTVQICLLQLHSASYGPACPVPDGRGAALGRHRSRYGTRITTGAGMAPEL